MRLNNLHPFYFPEDGIGTGIKDEVSDSDTGILDGLLAGKDNEGLADKDDDLLPDDKELGTDENLLLDGVDDKDNLLDIVSSRGIDLKKIKEKYPDFAKTNDFRELRNAYYRESKFSELFATIEDAQEAAENNETFSKINEAVIGRGDIGAFLSAVKESSPEAFEKNINGILDAVAKIDINLFNKAIASVMIKRIARDLQIAGERFLKRDAENTTGQALVMTGKNILQHYFEDDSIDTTERSKADDPRERDLSAREQKIQVDKLNGAIGQALNAVDHHLTKLISDGLDPDGKFNDFTKDTLIDRIKKEVQGQIDHDELHKRRMTSLWKRAEQSDYNRESLSRIVAAYLERARPIIPGARNKFRAMAIGKKQNENESEDKTIRMPRSFSGKPVARDGKIDVKSVDSKKIDYNKTSDEDIFEGRVKLKA